MLLHLIYYSLIQSSMAFTVCSAIQSVTLSIHLKLTLSLCNRLSVHKQTRSLSLESRHIKTTSLIRTVICQMVYA